MRSMQTRGLAMEAESDPEPDTETSALPPRSELKLPDDILLQ
jgi:hypothetical protein